ncbi:MAG: hypothetical protein P1V19_08700 [Gimesia sp.]|nr:hypothetical protein [Gimesia sp.]
MPEYYYTATDQAGKRTTSKLDAASSQAALLELESADYSKIILHTDDFSAALTEMMPQKVPVKNRLPASEHVEIRSLTDMGFFKFLLKKLYWTARWYYFVAAILLFYFLRESDRYVVAFCFTSLLLLLIPVGIAVKATWFSKTRKYFQLLEDFTWGRWDEVLALIPKLRSHIPAIELSGRKASALAALGRLDEALEIMEPYANAPEIPAWMYFTRLAEIYEYAHEQEQALDYRSKAHSDAPDNSTVLLGYANTLLKQNKDPRLAQRLIQEAEQQPLSDMLEMILPFIKGLLELNRGEPRLAFHLFIEGQNRIQPLLKSQSVARFYSDIGRAYAAIALAELGEKEQAAIQFELALPRLQALDSKLLIERYESVS